MRKLKSLLVLILLCTSASMAYAQEKDKERNSYLEIKAGYILGIYTGDHSNLLSMVNEKDGDEGLMLNGLYGSITYNFAISSHFGIEVGASVNAARSNYKTRDYSYSSGKDIKIDNRIVVMDAEVPFVFTYNIPLGNHFVLTPLIGGHVKYNVTAKYQRELNAKYNFNGEDNYVVDKDHWVETTDYLDKEFGDDGWKRLQFGPQAGVKVSFRKFVLSAVYEMDFPEAMKGCNTSRVKAGVGYRF